MRTAGIQDGGVAAYNLILNLNSDDLGRYLIVWGREIFGYEQPCGDPAVFRGCLVGVCHERGRNPMLVLDDDRPMYVRIYAEMT